MTDVKPNIVLIMTDQQRWDFFKSEGFPVDTMPFVDGLGARGMRFSRAYTPMPTCTPARTSMLTGRFPKATRVKQNWDPEKHATFADDIPGVLRKAGYTVNLAGKNHSYVADGAFDFNAGVYGHLSGPPSRATPEQKAFDDWLRKLDHHVQPAGTPFALENQLCYRIVSDAMECVDRNLNTPFFLWLSLPEPHNPYQAPEPYFSMFPPEEMPDRVGGPDTGTERGGHWLWLRNLQEGKRPGYDEGWRRARAVYCGMLRMIDDQLRRFADHLDKRNLLDNTILIFLSDHGDFSGDYGLQRKGVGLPEALVHIPFLAAGPGVAHKPNRTDFVSLVDVLPTICEIVGVDIPFGCQGRSLWPMLTGGAYPAAEFASIYSELGIGALPYGPDERPPLHFPYEGRSFDELNSATQSGNLKMVRKGDWKLLFDVMGRAQLYNIASDPGEMQDRYADAACAAIRTDMLEELLKWTIRTEDSLPLIKYVPKTAPHGWYSSEPEAGG